MDVGIVKVAMEPRIKSAGELHYFIDILILIERTSENII